MKTTPVLLNLRKTSAFALLALFLVVFLPIATSPLAMAFGGSAGNPFGNGSYFSTEGTFQNTIRGKNLSGVATFSTGDAAASVMPSGSFTVSYQGLTYVGNVDASIDPAASSIAAAMEASITRQGSGTAINTISSSYVPTGTQTVSGGTAVVNLPDQVTVVDAPPALPVTTTVSGLTQTINLPDTTADTFGWVDEIGTSKYQDTSYASGSFTAKLKNSFPNQIFKGKGKMEFTAINFDLSPPALVTTSVNISVKGVRISSTAQTFTEQTVQAPSVITTTDFVNR